MNTAAADQIAKAVLYEGYMLYPYRPSAVKNRQRFNFGVICPKAYSDAQKGTERSGLVTECLAQAIGSSRIEVHFRFLQLVERCVEETAGPTVDPAKNAPSFRATESLTVDGRAFYSWQEAVEREFVLSAVDLDFLIVSPLRRPFHLPTNATEEFLHNATGELIGRIVRKQQAIKGSICLSAEPLENGAFKIIVRVENQTQIDDAAHISRDYALNRSLVSAHVVLGIEQGKFVSLLDPPESLRSSAASCHNDGSFPVLVGREGEQDTVLASPIILYDYPQIAPESAGDLFDGTEIDEILSLRIMTMTDEEKHEMRESDERARQMLERAENLPAEQFMKLHGALRGLKPVAEENR